MFVSVHRFIRLVLKLDRALLWAKNESYSVKGEIFILSEMTVCIAMQFMFLRVCF